MKKLVDYCKILRSKNAGPLFITFDLIFEGSDEMEYVMKNLKKFDVAEAYGIDEKDIDIIAYKVVNSIKITLIKSLKKRLEKSLSMYWSTQEYINATNMAKTLLINL